MANSRQILTLLSTLFLALQLVSAGPFMGISTFACLFLPDFPTGPLDVPMPVHFEAGWNPQCMRSQSRSADMLVNGPGLTCVSIGRVLPEKSGSCRRKRSTMNLSYSYRDGVGPVNGTTGTWWGSAPKQSGEGPEGTRYAMQLQNSTGSAVVCVKKEECEAVGKDMKSVAYAQETKGPLYIMFKP